MGIQGLTTYITKQSDRYLEPFELHDTYLVIDGSSISCQLYNSCAKSNCAFGGDYDKYARIVSNFFDNLLKCNIIPLVLIDGAIEDEKLKTAISRAKEKIRLSSSYHPSKQRGQKFIPIFVKYVFKDILREKGIRSAQTPFEADNVIAAIAKLLNCPVLSYDSDFYIYGTSYIPFNTLDDHVIFDKMKNCFVKRCKLYRVESLLRTFHGLNKSVLPLAAILLGNDYVKKNEFNQFFSQIKIPKVNTKRHNGRQCRIEAALTWLSRHNLSDAITIIISKLPKRAKKKVIDVVKRVMDIYNNQSISMLTPLGFSDDQIQELISKFSNEGFKFDCDISNLSTVNETDGIDNNKVKNIEEEVEEEIQNLVLTSENSNKAVINKLPSWFVREFNLGAYPSYFYDIIVRKLYICPIQVEDYFYDTANVVSFKIIAVIYGLITSEFEDLTEPIKCIIRGKQNRMQSYYIEPTNLLPTEKPPSLSNLRKFSVESRRNIINNTLEITDDSVLNELPSEWILYIIVMKYWTNHQIEFLTPCHVKSLLFAMLFNVIDEKIGYCRNSTNFQQKYQAQIEKILLKRKEIQSQQNYSTNTTISQALSEVTKDDCLLAALFFIHNFEVDQKLYSNGKKFNIAIVHFFSQFQSCLCHSMNLNALLNYPYQQTKVANLFDGTLLYNLFTNFKQRNNVNEYIDLVLQNSPSLQRLIRVIFSKILPFLQITESIKTNRRKKQKTKNKVSDDEKYDDEIIEYESNEPFYDANNPFTTLS